MSREVACIFRIGKAMEPQLINNIATVAFCAFKDFDTSLEGDCIMEFISAEKISNVGNWGRF